MKYLLDTNPCVRYLTGRSPHLRQRLDSVGDGEICVCTIVEAELYFGAAKSTDPVKTLRFQRQFLSRFRSLPFDAAAATAYGPLRATLERGGEPIGAHDLLIAAIAVAQALMVVTHNVAEFSRVPGLVIEDWETELSDK